MKVAINKNVINKTEDKNLFKIITHTFENVDFTQQELENSINQGYAFCAQHKDKHRLSKNFTAAGFIAVDVDHGLTIQQALDDPFVQQYGSIFYTTPSHTEESHRFRIIFEVDSEITDQGTMKNAYRGISKKLGGDPACKDACRLFFGSKDSNPIVLGKTIPPHILEEIILLGKESARQHTTARDDGKDTKDRDTIRSKKKLDIDMIVRDRDGNEHRLGDLGPTVSIHCPVHTDKSPSAFTVLSKSGVIGVHCSSCQATYFTENESPTINFNYSLNNLKSLENDNDIELADNGIVETVSSITRISKPYLDIPHQPASITFIKSPKGTGKTQWLESLVKRFKEEERTLKRKADEMKKQNPHATDAQCRVEGKRILLIGHRQSLIRSVSKRLGLTAYIDFLFSPGNGDGSDVIINIVPANEYAICADSLSTTLNPKVHKYDVVIVDEVEQVFSHLTGSTVKDKRIPTYLYFKHYIDAAKEVYLLDADLNELTINTVCGFVEDTSKPIRMVINDYIGNANDIYLYSSKAHLKQELMEALDSGESCFVCCNSKKEVYRIGRYVEEHYGQRKKVIMVTSDNSNDADVQEFIRYIPQQIEHYDLVITSPSMGTGIDITFPNNESRIDNVFGFFESRVNTHFDIDQQLSRVRNPGRIRVWISPEKFNFETLVDVIKKEAIDNERGVRTLIGITPDGNPQYADNQGYLNLYADVLSLQRASKNNLRYNFIQMKRHYGWNVIEIDADDDKAEAGKAIQVEGALLHIEDRIKRIVEAKLITKNEYQNLIRKGEKARLTTHETDAMRRYEVESFYYLDATEDLVKLDSDGKTRFKVTNYEKYLTPDSELIALDKHESENNTYATDKSNRILWKHTMKEVLCAAGLATNEQPLLTNSVIRGDALSPFAEYCRAHKERIAQLFDIDIRKDISDKPVQQLSRLLNLLGITLTKLSSTKESGVKIYRYTITQESLNRLNDIVDRRKDSGLKESWHLIREETTVGRLFNEENPLRLPRGFITSVHGKPARSLDWREVKS